ncbi:MAG: AfsR/SARP family transcriptional regulator, partial [Actinocatenispora sp.]
MGTEFSVLGDLQVRAGGQSVRVGHSRQACVLAALLVDLNRVVPADQLAVRAWGDQPPQRARATLHTYLSRLRAALRPHPGVTLQRRPAGYVLGADPATVDLHRFRQLVAEARTAPDDGTARSMLDQALALWRGEPFASLDTPWLAVVRTGLEAERLAVELDRNDLRLRLGGHADLLAELTRQAATHPLDERLAGQLILAQYRSGRQADALGTYEALRRRLVADLGADPGARLRELHHAVLTNDPAVAAPCRPTLPAGGADPAAPVA